MFRSLRFSLLSAVLSILPASPAKAVCPPADLNADCRVDLRDVRILAESWLAPPENPADLNGDDSIDIDDFALLAEQWYEAGTPLAINELMASNSSCIRDPQGQYDDWIEIHNYGPEAVDIGGMYLTDDLAVPTKWRIPANSRLPGGGYLLVWADNDTSDAGLHANFRLSAGGEQICLVDRDGITLIDSVTFGEQTSDISYGRYPDASDDLRFFGHPSPAARNDGAYLGEIAEVGFSHRRGFYDTPFYLTLATETDDAVVYYSLDGSEPYQMTNRGVAAGATGTRTVSSLHELWQLGLHLALTPATRAVTSSEMFIKIYRDADDGNDDLSGDAELVAVRFAVEREAK